MVADRERLVEQLRGTPIVVLDREPLAPVARAGAVRADRGAAVAVIGDLDPSTPSSIGRDIDVVIAVCRRASMARTLRTAADLGGRGIPVLDLAGDGEPTLGAATLELLADPGLRDLNVPVPVVEAEAVRHALWDLLRAAGVGERHHPVEVDGRPALAELRSRGLPVADGDLRALAAGAAGVLAGRLAAGGRAWVPAGGA